MQFNTYTSAGAFIAAALVNEPSATALTDVLARHAVHRPTADDAAMTELRPWAGRLRVVFETTGPEQAAAAGALLVDADCRPRLVAHDGLPHHLHPAPLDTDLVTRVKALTAAGLAQLISDGAADRLGHCSRTGCSVVFVDVSRNGRRTFCSVRCANTVNVRRHRARRRTGSSRG
ncbi:CGNR zinc finger domain-containing protein [Streptomyces sp. NPDC021100]|uniref:CGNR zinc finger domain-containing protein n=1 Tax=Streptomyces sp. NPDC021100 TaxID=3365114 RepID=UPI0037A94C78